MRHLILSLLAAFMMAAVAPAQITVNIKINDSPNATLTIATDGEITLETWFGFDLWNGQAPEWAVPDGITYTGTSGASENGGDGWNIPADKVPAGLDILGHVVEAYAVFTAEALWDAVVQNPVLALWLFLSGTI